MPSNHHGEKIILIIPAFNEEKNIAGVIKDLRKDYPPGDILVVNDGSMDQTGSIAKSQGAAVVNLPHNLGIGGAMQTGYRYAYLNNYDIAVQVDGDGQHPPDQIGKLVQVVVDGKADMAIGSRFIVANEYRGSKSRRIGMILFAGLLSMMMGQRLTDTTSGFRAVNRRVIHLFSQYYPEDYPEVEALILLHRRGLRMAEVPIEMKERIEGRSSITPFKSIYYMIKVTLAVMIEMLRKTG